MVLSISLEDVFWAKKQFLSSLKIRSLIHGNILQPEAIEIMKRFEKKIEDAFPLPLVCF
jgi:hypothetical protein